MRVKGVITTAKGEVHEERVCLNEIAITRKSSNRIILELYINGDLVTETAGDGLLIGTPTGSTAYSLSAGGPVVEQDVSTIMIVPIAPNSLSFRPICLASSHIIQVKVTIVLFRCRRSHGRTGSSASTGSRMRTFTWGTASRSVGRPSPSPVSECLCSL